MRSMFHCQARATGSNASSPSSPSAVKNWIAKNGLPPVFSYTSCARGLARSVPQCRVRDQVLEEVERCCIQPLQIIEEQRERVLVASEHPEEAPENHLEAVLRILRRQVRDRSLLSNHKLQLGDEVDDELTIRAQGLA